MAQIHKGGKMSNFYNAFIEDDKLTGIGENTTKENALNISVTEEVYNLAVEKGVNYFCFLNGEIVINENYENELAEKERERVNGLKCTKRVFALMLQQMGVDYLTQLKPLIESNPQAQLEWELCVELERGNPLIDVMAEQLGVSSDKLDALFKFANNEITQEEFVQAITPQEEIKEEVEEVVE